MRLKIPIATITFVIILTSCTNKTHTELVSHTLNNIDSMESKVTNDEFVSQIFQNKDLDELIENFHFPSKNQRDFKFENKQFPPKLINILMETVYNGDVEKLFQNMNQKNLMITVDDFVFQPSNDSNIDSAEKDLYEALQEGAGNFLIYQCDVDKDGIDEIIMAENLKYDYSTWNRVFLLRKSEDKYVYCGYDYLGYYCFLSIFEYDGAFYLLANYDDYKTGISKALGLFSLNGNQSGFMWLTHNSHTYIRKTSNDYRYHLLYENQNSSMTENVKAYIEEIGTDLIYTERKHNTFYGDESKKNALIEEARNSDQNNNFWSSTFTADADNDGQEELFTRRVGDSNSIIKWYDHRTFLECSPPNDVWKPENFKLAQAWFKTIDNKTVSFSLYRKNGEDVFLLDARLYQDGQTVILADYFVELDINICLSDYWDYNDTNRIHIDYKNPDFEKAFPEAMLEWADSFAQNVCGEFRSVNFKDENIPNDLILDAEEKLFKGTSNILDSEEISLKIDSEKFFNNFFP